MRRVVILTFIAVICVAFVICQESPWEGYKNNADKCKDVCGIQKSPACDECLKGGKVSVLHICVDQGKCIRHSFMKCERCLHGMVLPYTGYILPELTTRCSGCYEDSGESPAGVVSPSAGPPAP